MQVFNCTPDQLLPSVRAELEELMQVCVWVRRLVGGGRGEAGRDPAGRGTALVTRCGWAQLACRHSESRLCSAVCAWHLVAERACPARASLPASSPSGLHPALLPQAGGTLLEGCVRPGCTQLTVNALVTHQRIQELQVGAGPGPRVCAVVRRVAAVRKQRRHWTA